MTKNPEVREVVKPADVGSDFDSSKQVIINHALDNERSKAYQMSYADSEGENQKIFFSVSEPLWAKNEKAGHPKGTIVLFHGPNERSELYTDFIHQKTDEGYRVVAFDMPGSGLSSKDAQVGQENLLHVDSMDECADAARKVINFVQNEEAYKVNPGGIHFVSSSAGSIVALKTIEGLPASTVSSITQVNSVFDVDPDLYLSGRDPVATIDTSMNTTQEIVAATGSNLEKLREQFEGVNNPPARWTESYVKALEEGAEDLDTHYVGTPEIIETLARNNVSVGIIYDRDIDGFFDADDTTAWIKDARSNGVSVEVTEKNGYGPDLLFNPDTKGDVDSAIDQTVHKGSVYVDVVDKLKTVHRVEWNQMPKAERQEMQKLLEAKGYSVGPTGIDATPRYGGVSFTEHAIAEFLIEADKANKLKDENGMSIKLSDLKEADFNADTIKNITEQTDFMNPGPEPLKQAASSPALVSKMP